MVPIKKVSPIRLWLERDQEVSLWHTIVLMDNSCNVLSGDSWVAGRVLFDKLTPR